MKTNLKSYLLLITTSFVLSSCTDDGFTNPNFGGTEVYSDTESIQASDVVLKVNGECGSSRSYRVLESPIIELGVEKRAIYQLLIYQDQTFELVTESFDLVQTSDYTLKYKNLRITKTQGDWSISGPNVNLENVGKISRFLIYDNINGTSYFRFVTDNSSIAPSTTFKKTEKISDQNIPSKFGCSDKAYVNNLKAEGSMSWQNINVKERLTFRDIISEGEFELLRDYVHASSKMPTIIHQKLGIYVRGKWAVVALDYINDDEVVAHFHDHPDDEHISTGSAKFKLKIFDNYFELTHASGFTFTLSGEPGMAALHLHQSGDLFTNW